MRDARSYGWTGPGLAVAAVVLLAPIAACLESGESGDPGPAFLSGSTGTAGSTGTGTAGSRGGGNAGSSGSGTAGAPPPRTTGGAGQGAAGHGVAGQGAAGQGAGGTSGKPAACVIGATATFELAWTLEDAAGTATTCDAAAASTVDITAVNAKTGAEAASTVPCNANMATTCAMPAGDYAVTLKLRGPAGATLSEIWAPTLALRSGQVTHSGALPFQVGGSGTTARGFALTWSIDNADTGAALTCDAAGAKTVRLVAGTKTFDFPCASGKARTTSIVAGDTPVKVSLLDADGAALSATDVMTLHVNAGQLVFLGDVVFDVI